MMIIKIESPWARDMSAVIAKDCCSLVYCSNRVQADMNVHECRAVRASDE